MTISLKALACAALVSMAGTASSWAQPDASERPAPDKQPKAGEGVKFEVETFVKGVEVPWAIEFLPDGDMLFTERTGRVRLVKGGKLEEKPVYEVPGLWTGGGEIGLMGLCVHPDFKDNGFVYISYGYRPEKDIRVERFVMKDGAFTSGTVIMKGFPAASNHAGCKLAFGPDKKLYITVGERFRKELAQDMSSLGGKILRVNDDGTVPDDNPFVGKEGVRPEIWAIGARNAQGMDWQPGTGVMFETEHGPSGEPGLKGPRGDGDEFNVVKKGDNLGWPLIHHDQTQEGLVTPLIQWSPGVAPASGVFYKGELFPELTGNFLVGTLRGNRLIRIVLDGEKVVKQETMLEGVGRIRCVAEGPDGSIYVSTSNRDGRGRPSANDDRIFRLTPRK